MNFEKVLTSLASSISKSLLQKNDLSESEEKLLVEAFAIQLLVEKKPKLIEDLMKIAKDGNPEIQITTEFEASAYENFLRNAFHDNFIYRRAESICDRLQGTLDNLYQAFFIDLWNSSTKDDNTVDKYCNTHDPYFNEVAYFWKFSIEIQENFPDISIFFDCVVTYFDFVKNSSKPQYCRDLITTKITQNALSEEQQIVLLDNLAEFLFKNDDERLVKIYLEIIDLRNSISPVDDDPNYDIGFWTIEKIRERLLGHTTILEKIKYLEHSKLEYKRQSDELEYDIGISEEIDIEIDYYKMYSTGLRSMN